jgi:hypothetical protein
MTSTAANSECSGRRQRLRCGQFELGNFQHPPARFRKRYGPGTEPLKNRADFLDVDGRKEVARVLPLELASIDVFRAALVSIVLTLTLGQNVALLCRVWCHPYYGANSACGTQVPTTSPTATANESCAQVANGPAPFVREEDGRKPASASDGQQGLVIARFQFVPPPSLSARDRDRREATQLDARPLVLALRI